MYLIMYIVAYSEYLPPMGRRRSVKNIACGTGLGAGSVPIVFYAAFHRSGGCIRCCIYTQSVSLSVACLRFSRNRIAYKLLI